MVAQVAEVEVSRDGAVGYRQARYQGAKTKIVKELVRNSGDPAQVWALYAGQLGIANDGKANSDADGVGKLDQALAG